MNSRNRLDFSGYVGFRVNVIAVCLGGSLNASDEICPFACIYVYWCGMSK